MRFSLLPYSSMHSKILSNISVQEKGVRLTPKQKILFFFFKLYSKKYLSTLSHSVYLRSIFVWNKQTQFNYYLIIVVLSINAIFLHFKVGTKTKLNMKGMILTKWISIILISAERLSPQNKVYNSTSSSIIKKGISIFRYIKPAKQMDVLLLKYHANAICNQLLHVAIFNVAHFFKSSRQYFSIYPLSVLK